MTKTTASLLLLLAALTACNTVEGAGADINAAGKAISNTAHKTKDAIAK